MTNPSSEVLPSTGFRPLVVLPRTGLHPGDATKYLPTERKETKSPVKLYPLPFEEKEREEVPLASFRESSGHLVFAHPPVRRSLEPEDMAHKRLN